VQRVADAEALGWRGCHTGGSLEGHVALAAPPRSTPVALTCTGKEISGWCDILAGLEASTPPSFLASLTHGGYPSVGGSRQQSVGGCLGGPMASAAPPPRSNL
jgi:hypothetical protein